MQGEANRNSEIIAKIIPEVIKTVENESMK